MTTRIFCDCCDKPLGKQQDVNGEVQSHEFNMTMTDRFSAMVQLQIQGTLRNTDGHLCKDCLWRTIDRADPRGRETT